VRVPSVFEAWFYFTLFSVSQPDGVVFIFVFFSSLERSEMGFPKRLSLYSPPGFMPMVGSRDPPSFLTKNIGSNFRAFAHSEFKLRWFSDPIFFLCPLWGFQPYPPPQVVRRQADGVSRSRILTCQELLVSRCFQLPLGFFPCATCPEPL